MFRIALVAMLFMTSVMSSVAVAAPAHYRLLPSKGLYGALNPQPLPPAPPDRMLRYRGGYNSLNPQPLPPEPPHLRFLPR